MGTFTIVLTSSVIAATLTSIVNWWLQRNNYRNDYYKKIIDKRMTTYDSIYQVISRLQSIELHTDGRKMHGTLTEFEYYQDFIVTLAKESLTGVWLSNNFAAELTNFSNLMYEKFGFASDENPIPSHLMRKMAADSYDEITRQKNTLLKQLVSDLLSLHEVPKFLKSRN